LPLTVPEKPNVCSSDHACLRERLVRLRTLLAMTDDAMQQRALEAEIEAVRARIEGPEAW
jgi:hypothetical protein